jgi:hypothetical protein
MATSATVMTPLRAAPEFCATVNAKVPPPVPDRGDDVIQLTLVPTAHAHPPGAESVTVPVPPAAGKLLTFAAAENWQAVALCRTGALCPLMAMALSRAVALGFGATRN